MLRKFYVNIDSWINSMGWKEKRKRATFLQYIYKYLQYIFTNIYNTYLQIFTIHITHILSLPQATSAAIWKKKRVCYFIECELNSFSKTKNFGHWSIYLPKWTLLPFVMYHNITHWQSCFTTHNLTEWLNELKKEANSWLSGLGYSYSVLVVLNFLYSYSWVPKS